MLRPKPYTLLVLSALALTVLACQSQQTGDAGLLTFSYVTDDQPANFNKPLAVGASITMRVREAGFGGALQPPDITATTTDDPSIISAGSFSGNEAVFTGVSVGDTKLRVTATLQSGQNRGSSVEDSISFRSAEVTDVQLFHTCTLQTTGHYLTNTQDDIWVTYELLTTNQLGRQEPVIGYGIYPITVEPSDAMTLDINREDQQWFHFTGFPTTTSTVTLRGSIGDSALTFNFVEPGAVTSARLAKWTDGCVGDTEREFCTFAGDPLGTTFYVQPLLADDSPICQSDLNFEILNVSTNCTVEKLGSSPNDDVEDTESSPDTTLTEEPETVGANEINWIRVKAAAGAMDNCTFTVNYPDGNNGMGAMTELTVTVKTDAAMASN